MITRTTLKTLWLAGGGVIATWLAVSPHHSVPATAPSATAPQPSSTTEITAEDFNTQADKLRARTNAIRLQQSTRNPFRFHAPKTSAKSGSRADRPGAPAAAVPDVPAAPPAPVLTLSGIAEKRTPEGARRTAVITGDGQMYVVGVGDAVAGRYTVASIDPEAVVLRDASGGELRLMLRQ